MDTWKMEKNKKRHQRQVCLPLPLHSGHYTRLQYLWTVSIRCIPDWVNRNARIVNMELCTQQRCTLCGNETAGQFFISNVKCRFFFHRFLCDCSAYLECNRMNYGANEAGVSLSALGRMVRRMCTGNFLEPYYYREIQHGLPWFRRVDVVIFSLLFLFLSVSVIISIIMAFFE